MPTEKQYISKVLTHVYPVDILIPCQPTDMESSMEQAALNEILEKHKKWLRDEDGGEKANLRSANLGSANLGSANLRYADLGYADLSYADLSYANLRYANLRSANLRSANLGSANLRYANLGYADLSSANLGFADLRYANLRSANLGSANLRYADLRYAKNMYLLPVQDPRGYMFPHAIMSKHGWRIVAGCRRFSIDEARAHWGKSYHGERWIGEMYLHACDWLEARISEDEKQEAAA